MTTPLDKVEELEKLKKDKLYSRTIPDGLYFIKPQTCQNKALQMEMHNINIIDAWDYSNINKQKFYIKYDNSHRCYYIQNLANELFFTCENTKIFFAVKNDSKNQQWHIITDESNNYEIISEENNNLIELEKENVINGDRIFCQPRTGKLNQKFNFEPTNQFSYFPIPDFHPPYSMQNSIVDGLKCIGEDANQENRKLIGDFNRIQGTPFSPEYNLQMVELLKAGKLIKPWKKLN